MDIHKAVVVAVEENHMVELVYGGRVKLLILDIRLWRRQNYEFSGFRFVIIVFDIYDPKYLAIAMH